MAKIREIINAVEDFAPLENQEEYDNSGLTVGYREGSADSVLIAVDVTPEVVDEAVIKGCGLIIAHHPVIFHPISNINTDTLQGELLLKIIRSGLSVYSAHTNVDNADENISREMISLLNVESICPVADTCGMQASLEKPCAFKELAELISKITGDTNIRTIGDPEAIVEEICFVNGAGGKDEEILLKAGVIADVFITSELKYNLAVMAKQLGLNVIECGHFESEREFLRLMSRKIGEKLPELMIIESEAGKSPYNAR